MRLPLEKQTIFYRGQRHTTQEITTTKIKHSKLQCKENPTRYVTFRLGHWKALHGFPKARRHWRPRRALPYHCETMTNEECEHGTKNPTQTYTEKQNHSRNQVMVMKALLNTTYLKINLMAWKEINHQKYFN